MKLILALSVLLASSAHSYEWIIRDDDGIGEDGNPIVVEAPNGSFAELDVLNLNEFDAYPPAPGVKAYYDNEFTNPDGTKWVWGERFIGQTIECIDTSLEDNIPRVRGSTEPVPNGKIVGDPSVHNEFGEFTGLVVSPRIALKVYQYGILLSKLRNTPTGPAPDADAKYQHVAVTVRSCGNLGDAGMAWSFPVASTAVSFDLYFDVVSTNANNCRLGREGAGIDSRFHLEFYDVNGDRLGHRDLVNITDFDACPLRLSFTSTVPIAGVSGWGQNFGGAGWGRFAIGDNGFVDLPPPVEPPPPPTIEERLDIIEAILGIVH